MIIQDLEEIEEWNEFGELKGVIGEVPTNATSHVIAPATQTIKTTPTTAIYTATAISGPAVGATANPKAPATADDPASAALRKAVFEAAAAAKKPSTTTKAIAKEPIDEEKPFKEDTSVAETPKSSVNDENSPKLVTRKSSTGSSTTSRQFVPEHFDPNPSIYHGSSVSIVSDAEIKEIECASAIPEEDEDEDEDEEEDDEEEEKVAEKRVEEKKKPVEKKSEEKKPEEKKLEEKKPEEKKPEEKKPEEKKPEETKVEEKKPEVKQSGLDDGIKNLTVEDKEEKIEE
jgi:hypothetical protein